MTFSEVPALLGLADWLRGWRGGGFSKSVCGESGRPGGLCKHVGPRRPRPSSPPRLTGPPGPRHAAAWRTPERPAAPLGRTASSDCRPRVAAEGRGSRAGPTRRETRRGARPHAQGRGAPRAAGAELADQPAWEAASGKRTRQASQVLQISPCRAARRGRRLHVPEPQTGARRQLRARRARRTPRAPPQLCTRPGGTKS